MPVSEEKLSLTACFQVEDPSIVVCLERKRLIRQSRQLRVSSGVIVQVHRPIERTLSISIDKSATEAFAALTAPNSRHE